MIGQGLFKDVSMKKLMLIAVLSVGLSGCISVYRVYPPVMLSPQPVEPRRSDASGEKLRLPPVVTPQATPSRPPVRKSTLPARRTDNFDLV